jgi:hypothetical protein
MERGRMVDAATLEFIVDELIAGRLRRIAP